MSTKRTYQPKKRHRPCAHGFTKHVVTANDRGVLAECRKKGRKVLFV